MTYVTRASPLIRMHSTGDPISTNPLSRFKQLPPSVSLNIEIAAFVFSIDQTISLFTDTLESCSNLAQILARCTRKVGGWFQPQTGTSPE